jgi:hypothetical protein
MNEQLLKLEKLALQCKSAITVGDFTVADMLARQIITTSPSSVDAYNLIGNVAIRLGEPRNAARWFGIATCLDSKNTISLRLNFAMALEMAGSGQEALEGYWALHRGNPKNSMFGIWAGSEEPLFWGLYEPSGWG